MADIPPHPPPLPHSARTNNRARKQQQQGASVRPQAAAHQTRAAHTRGAESSSSSKISASASAVSVGLRPAEFDVSHDGVDGAEVSASVAAAARMARHRGNQAQVEVEGSEHARTRSEYPAGPPESAGSAASGGHARMNGGRKTRRVPIDELQEDVHELPEPGRYTAAAASPPPQHDGEPDAQASSFVGPGMNGGQTQTHYRQHVHGYTNAQPANLYVPPPSDVGSSASGPLSAGPISYEPSPVYPPTSLPSASACAPSPSPTSQPQAQMQAHHHPQPMIAGIPSDIQSYSINSFSSIQNRPRTPHELLGIPAGKALNLWSLPDALPEEKPKFNYHVLVKLAILGNKGEKATLQDILRAIRMRFPYYEHLSKQESTAFGNSIRHLLSLLAAFVREPKPVTEPGKGAYWRVDFSKGEGNKRVRKRNKRKKDDDPDAPPKKGKDSTAVAGGSSAPVNGHGGMLEDDEDSEGDEPPPSALEGSVRSASGSVATTIEETAQQSTKAPRSRKPAPPSRNGVGNAHLSPVMTGSAASSASLSPMSATAAGTMANAMIDPSLIGVEGFPGPGSVAVGREGDVGAQRAHVARGKKRAAANPYPPAPPSVSVQAQTHTHTPAPSSAPAPGQVASFAPHATPNHVNMPSPAMTTSEHAFSPASSVIVLAQSQSQSSDIGSPAGGQLHLQVNDLYHAQAPGYPPPSQQHHQHHQQQLRSQAQAHAQFSPPVHPHQLHPQYDLRYANASSHRAQQQQQQHQQQPQGANAQYVMYHPSQPGHAYHPSQHHHQNQHQQHHQQHPQTSPYAYAQGVLPP